MGACHGLSMLGVNSTAHSERARIPRAGPGRHKAGEIETGSDHASRRPRGGGHPPVEETKCCRLQQTTRAKHGANTAYASASDRIEDEGYLWAASEFTGCPSVPVRKTEFGRQLDAGDYVLGWEGDAKMKAPGLKRSACLRGANESHRSGDHVEAANHLRIRQAEEAGFAAL